MGHKRIKQIQKCLFNAYLYSYRLPKRIEIKKAAWYYKVPWTQIRICISQLSGVVALGGGHWKVLTKLWIKKKMVILIHPCAN